jgi:hypothetical protein
MGILGAEESMGSMELEELHRMLVARANPERRKDGDEFKEVRVSSEAAMDADDVEKLVVCVTSGVSYLGLAIVKELLVRRYSVRIIAENQGDYFLYQNFSSLFESRNHNTCSPKKERKRSACAVRFF